MIYDQIERKVAPRTVIPKPRAMDHTVEGYGSNRRGEREMRYTMPCSHGGKKRQKKSVTESEFEEAYRAIEGSGIFTMEWFRQNMPSCASDGECNFYTIGGIFVFLGIADHEDGKALYRLRR